MWVGEFRELHWCPPPPTQKPEQMSGCESEGMNVRSLGIEWVVGDGVMD